MEYNLAESSVFYYFISMVIVGMALGVLFARTTIQALLFLVMTMLSVGVLFVAQGAVFLGGVQLAVYAGAVMVLFLMVLFLTEEQEEQKDDGASIGKMFKVGAVGIFLGLCSGAFSLKSYSNSYDPKITVMAWTKKVAHYLFLDHMFLFEVLGIFLLVMAVAVIAVSKFEESDEEVSNHDGN